MGNSPRALDQGVEHVVVRAPYLGRPLLDFSHLQELVPGGEYSYRGFPVNPDHSPVHEGEHPDLVTPYLVALPEDHISLLQILPSPPYVGPLTQFSFYVNDLSFRLCKLYRDYGVRAFGDRGSGEYLYRRSPFNPRRDLTAGRLLSYKPELGGILLRSSFDVLKSHGEAVHSGVVEQWLVRVRGHVLGEEPS